VGTPGARPLLTAKLLVPSVRPGTVSRPRLHEHLDGRAGHRLTLVTAPAGWGKTTLLSVWAAEECGGVTIAVQRGDHFTLTVCPAGKRPPLSYHVPSMATPGYVGPFGPDAYITMTEH